MDKILCKEFLNDLASASPVPGGGGASAYVAALGTALGAMVGNLTLGKKKYADVQSDIQGMLDKLYDLMNELYGLLEEDAKYFEPLAKAYGLPSSTEAEKERKSKVLEKALVTACEVPLRIMRKTLEVLEILSEMKEKGTKIAISDVAVGAQFLGAALLGASMNIYINAKLIKDREKAEELVTETDHLAMQGREVVAKVFDEIRRELKWQET